MSIAKIYVGTEFKDLCSLDFRLYKNGIFYKVKNGDKIFVNGEWKTIVCTLDFKWIIDETGSYCEQSPANIDLDIDLATPLIDDGTINITIDVMPATVPVIKRNIVTGSFLFDLTWIERNSSGTGPSVFNPGFSNGTPPLNPYVEQPIGRLSDPQNYPSAEIELYGTGYNGYTLKGKIDTSGYIWVTEASSMAITAWNPSDPIYKMRLYNLDAAGEFGGSNPIVNTTYRIQTKRKKVSVTGEYPLDVNNQRTDGPDGSGLPQATKTISSGESDYRVINTTLCPAPQTWFGNAEISGNFTKECSSGNTGSIVPYTIPANKYYRPTQVEADAYAQTQLIILGQQNANINGICNPAVYPFKWILDQSASYCEEIPEIGCGATAAFSGGQTFPSLFIINLGSSIGQVDLDFDAVGVPDKFILEFDGVEVINTGYRGDSAEQAALNAALAAKGLPPETIAGGPTGIAFFNKTTGTTIATLKVYAPISGTAWNCTVSCPVNP